MSKHLIDVDEELLARAREELGTTTIRETVNQALAEVVELSARRRALLAAAGEPLIAEPGALAKAWE